jgi:GAF domain-containing protein
MEDAHMAQTTDENCALLIASIQQQTEELTELNRIAIALTSEFDLQQLLQMMTDAARKTTAAEHATFFLIPEIVDESNPAPKIKVVFELTAISGATEHLEKHFRHLEPIEGIDLLRSVFGEGSSIVVGNVYQNSSYVGIPRGHIPVRSFLGVHLRK